MSNDENTPERNGNERGQDRSNDRGGSDTGGGGRNHRGDRNSDRGGDRSNDRGGSERNAGDKRQGGRGRSSGGGGGGGGGWMASLTQWLENPQTQPNMLKGNGCDQGVTQLEELGYEAFLIDLSGSNGREDVMKAFGKGMTLAKGFDESWDTLEEQLFPPAEIEKTRVLVMRGYQALRRRDSYTADVLFDVIDTVANTPNSRFRGVIFCR